MCQFLMQKVSANVNLAGGLNPHYGEQLPEEIPAMPEMPKATDESFLEVSSSVSFPNSKDRLLVYRFSHCSQQTTTDLSNQYGRY